MMATEGASTQPTAGELRDKERRNWVKCSLGLQEIAKALRPHVDKIFLDYFEKNKFLSEECCHKYHAGLCPCKNTKNYCVCCNLDHKGNCAQHKWKDDDHKVRKRRDGKWILGTTSMSSHMVPVDLTCKTCKTAIRQSVSVHDNCKQCNNKSITTKCNACQAAIEELEKIMQNVEIIYWENIDIPKVFDSHWNVAKIFMPKGNKCTDSAKEADVACLLAMFHNCTLFKVDRVTIGAMIGKRNEVIHQSEQRFGERTKNEFFQLAIGFLTELNQIYTCMDQITTMNELQQKEVTAEMFNEADESMIQDLLNEISDRLASGQSANELVERLRWTMKNQAMRIITKEKEDAIQIIERKHQLDLSQINDVITKQEGEIESLRTVVLNKTAEIKSLEENNTELEEKNKHLSERNITIMAEKEALEWEISMVKETLNESEERLEKLNQQEKKLKLEIVNLRTAIFEREQEIERLGFSVFNQDNEIKRLYAKSMEQEHKIKGFQTETLQLKEEKEIYEQNFRHEQIKSQRLRLDFNAVEKENKLMHETINEKEHEVGSLKAIVCNKDKELKHLKSANKEIEKKVHSVQNEKERIVEVNEKLKQSISLTNETVQKQESELGQLKQQILQLKAENTRFVTDIDRMKNEKNKLRLIVEEVNRLTTNYDEKETQTQIIYRRIEETETQRSCKQNLKAEQNLEDTISEKGKENENQKIITFVKDTGVKIFQSADRNKENEEGSCKEESQRIDNEFTESHTRYQDIESEVQQLKQENRKINKKIRTLLAENRELSAFLYIGCILSVFVAIWLLRLAMFIQLIV